MDKLPHSLLLQILSRLDDSADVARCRVASKEFNAVFPGLRSINLRCSPEWYEKVPISPRIQPLKTVFLDLVSKLETVESVFVDLQSLIVYLIDRPRGSRDDVFSITDENVAKEWLPRVSVSLKSLTIHDFSSHRSLILKSNLLPLLSAYCHNLVNMELRCVWLSMHNMNLMPMLTSLTLFFTRLEDQHLNELNRCFPNLQVLNLNSVKGLVDPKVHLLHLQTFHWTVITVYDDPTPSLTLIAPKLITLRILYVLPAEIHVEAPMLTDFYANIRFLHYFGSALFPNKFENNLKTLWLTSYYIGSFISQFPIRNTVEDLTLYSEHKEQIVGDFTLGKVFAVFPNVTSLRLNSVAWSDLEACLNIECCEIVDGTRGLKKILAYLKLADPLLTFSFVACLLDQCAGLLEVSLLIHADVDGTVSKGFMSKCTARWPGLKWRWGKFSVFIEDTWIADTVSD